MHDHMDDLRLADPVRDHRLVEEIDPRVLTDLRDEIVATPRFVGAKRASRWVSGGVSVAAVTAAAILLVPGPPAPKPIPATPLATPSQTVPATPASPSTPVGTGEWVKTAPSPLTPRNDSLTLWVDGSFLVVGGAHGKPCQAPENETCNNVDDALRDGALYNPETNLWRRIANAPEPIYVALAQPFAQVKAAAVGRTVYTLSQYWGFLSYSLETDSWQRLPDAPFNKVSSVYAWGESIVAYPFGAALSQAGRDASELVYEVFQPSTGTWTLHSTGHRLSSTASDATVVGNTLVIACAGDEDDPDYPLQPDDAVQVTLVDLATGAVTVPTTQPVSGIGFAPIALPSGLTAWLPHGFDESTPGTDQTKAWFLNPKTGEWTGVSFPDTIGPLVGGTLMASDPPVNRPWSLTASNMVALLGHLYDPATGRWSRNGELPGARIDVVYAGGDPGVLACWGYAATTDSTPQDDCYFLRPAAATSATP